MIIVSDLNKYILFLLCVLFWHSKAQFLNEKRFTVHPKTNRWKESVKAGKKTRIDMLCFSVWQKKNFTRAQEAVFYKVIATVFPSKTEN